MAISELTGRLVEQIEKAEKKQADAAARAAAKSWSTIENVVRREVAGIPNSDDSKALLNAVSDLKLNADEAVEAIGRIADNVDDELNLIYAVDEPGTRRTDEPTGHVLQRLGEMVRSNPHLHDGEIIESQLQIDRGLCDSICRHVAKASRLASAQRVIDGTTGDGFVDNARMQSATSLLATLVRHVAAGGSLTDDRADELTAVVAGEYIPNIDSTAVRVLFAIQLEEAAARDESESSSWHYDIRPTLARTWLREMRSTHAVLFDEPELATAAK